MNTTHARLTLTLLTAALLTGAAQAQGQDQSLELAAYQQMAGALDQSVQDRRQSAGASLADLDRAQAAYAALKPTLHSGVLSAGLDRSLQAARAALGRTPADLEAQVDQARGLLRRALHDDAVGLISSQPQNAAAAITLTAAEFGLSGVGRSAFVRAGRAGQAEVAARLLRQAAARRVNASLRDVSAVGGAINGPERARSYVALAQASSWFTVIQDAPEVGQIPGLQPALFGQALSQLTGGSPQLDATLGTLRNDAARLLTLINAAVSSAPAAGTSGRPASAQPLPAIPSNTPAVIPATGAAPALNRAAPAPSSGAVPSGGADSIYAALSRGLAAISHGDAPAAREQLARASTALARDSGLRAAPGYPDFTAALEGAQGQRGLTSSAVQALIGQLSGLEDSLAGRPLSRLDALSSSTSQLLSGPLRDVLFLILGLLALYPLYLLNLAFGGRNTYWRLIAAGLALLFLPTFLEGVGGFLGLLGDLLNVDTLRALGNLSLFRAAYGLPFWLLSVALALAATSYGFRGLCRQFGLLGGRARSASQTSVQTTALDWDEET